MRIPERGDDLWNARKGLGRGVALYIRKSRKDLELEATGEMETLARHEAMLRNLAIKQGLTIVKVYREIVSGESIDDRPQMQQLLEDVYEKKYDAVLVVEVERLARGETLDQGRVANAFKYSNTKIVTPTKTYDPNNEYDEEYFEFSLFMSRREFKTITRRMVRGKMQSLAEGNYMASHPPFGYDIIKKGRNNRTLKANDDAVHIEAIFRWFTEDRLSTREIAYRLTEMGIPSPSGKKEWHKMSIKQILTNPIYIGKMRWHERKLVKQYDGEKIVKSSKRTGQEEHKVIDGKHKGIISEETFEKAQQVFKQRSVPVKSDVTVKNPLAGLLKCKKCGLTMLKRDTKTARSRLVHPQSMTCKAKSIPLEDAFDSIIRGLKMHIEDFTFKMSNESRRAEADLIQRSIIEMEKELELLEEQKQTQMEMLERKVYTEDEFVQRRMNTKARIEAITSKLEEMKTEVPEDVDYEEKIITFSNVVEALKDESVSPKHKNDLLKDIIKRIEYEQTVEGVSLDIILK